jgi:hypothetical protein
MTTMRIWTLPICLLCAVALLLPLVAPAAPAAIALCALGGAALAWLAVRRKSAQR